MSVWSEFQPLKSVILGNIFPTQDLLSYLSLTPKWETNFKLINDQAIAELENIASVIRSFNVDVQRPSLYNLETNAGPAGPALSPRDWYFKYGDKTIVGNDAFENHNLRTSSTDHLLGNYYKIDHQNIWAKDSFNDLLSENLNRPYMHTANLLRCGMDIFISKNLGRTGNEQGCQSIVSVLKDINPKVRIHFIDCDEHLDSYLFFIKPGLMLSRITKDRLPDFFQKWNVIHVDEQFEVYNKILNYKWKKLNPIVAKEYSWFLQSNPEETLFSLNALSINESTVVFPGKSKHIFNALEKLGITCVSVDMRAISYWDSGLHCCTSEIDRVGDLEDYS